MEKSIDDDERSCKDREGRLSELRNRLKLNNDKINENLKHLETKKSAPDSQGDSQNCEESQMPDVDIEVAELQGIINKSENDAKVLTADIKKLMNELKNLRSSLTIKRGKFEDLATELNENEDCPLTARTRAMLSDSVQNLQLCKANRQRTIDLRRKQERVAKNEARLKAADELSRRAGSDALHRAFRNRVRSAYDDWVPTFFMAGKGVFDALSSLSGFCRSRYGNSRKFDGKYQVIQTLLQYLGVNGLLRIGGYVKLFQSFLVDFAQLGQYKAKLEGFATDQKDSDCYSGENHYNLRNVSDLHEHMQAVVDSDSRWQEVLQCVPEAETLVVDTSHVHSTGSAAPGSPAPGSAAPGSAAPSPTGTVILGASGSSPEAGPNGGSTIVGDYPDRQNPDEASSASGHYGQALDGAEDSDAEDPDAAPIPRLPCDDEGD